MAVERRSDSLQASQVRIRLAKGEVIGAGFLIAADVVCTCAHVVAQVFGLPASVEEAPRGWVDLDFPLLPARPSARASVVSWRHGGADVALLRLDAPVDGARPAGLVDGTGVWDHSFRVFGYPVGADHGMWVSGTLRAEDGLGLLQMEANPPGPRVAEGFSGSPVWDDVQGGVVGMTVAVHRGASTAYLLPSADLIDEQMMPSRCPFQGLSAFAEEDAEFFHGRENDTTRLHEAVRRGSMTLVVGPSGCGKSSLVRAGVLPRLRGEGMSASELRPVPGARATAILARALTDILEPGLGEIERLTRAEELARLLAGAEDILAELRGRVLARGQGADHLIFVDQLEEYARNTPADAAELFRLLSGLAGRAGAAVLRVIATARPDSLNVLVTAGTSHLVSDAVQFLAPLAADDLKRAVTAPVDAVPGLWFEPGLPERIVADAGDEPGRMPLVQFALTELWQRRSRSMLTHAAYDDLGGVAGALVTYADGVYAALTREQQALAPRLFVQLARPGDNYTFVRRPARTADLAPELLGLVRELTPGKLLVLSHTSGGAGQEEIVDLAHEALTELWPLLRRWLVESRDFRAWQEQLRADLHRWQAQKDDPARLLSGVDLAEADRKLDQHRKDVSDEEHAYIQLSHRNSRRRTRVRRAAIGALAVLTVISLVLAFSTWQGLQRAEQQLRLQAAGLLAQASEDHPADDPSTALQLALAAWNAWQTPASRQALLTQYVRGQYLLGSYPSVWQGRVTDLRATPDGRVLVVRSTQDGGLSRYTVITGAVQGKPQARELSGVPEGLVQWNALSPDGRFFAVTDGGAVRLWRLDEPTRPLLLPLAHEIAGVSKANLDFSSDSQRLLLTMKNNSRVAFAEAWEAESGSRIRVPDGLVPVRGANEAAFTADANFVVTISYTSDHNKRVEIRDFRTAQLRYTSTTKTNLISEVWLGAGGELLVRKNGDTNYSQFLGATPGHRTELPDAGFSIDTTSRYYLLPRDSGNTSAAGHYDEHTLIDLSTGEAYHARVPSAPDLSQPILAAAPHQGGGLVVLASLGTALMVVRAEPYDSRHLATTNTGDDIISVSPDRRFTAIAGERSLDVVDSVDTRRQSVPLSPTGGWTPWKLTWTADSQRVVVWTMTGNLVGAYPVRDLRDKVPLDDVLPEAKALASDDNPSLGGGEVEMIVALEGSEIALSTVDGRLARVDAADAALLTRPFLAQSAPWTGPRENGAVFDSGRLIARPQHPGQVALVTRSGAAPGEILLWDLQIPQHIATLSGLAISVAFSVKNPMVFDEGGSRLAVQTSRGGVRVWDVDGRKQLAGSAPVPGGDTLIGISKGDRVVTYREGTSISGGEVTVHDLADASNSDTLHLTGWEGGYLRGDHLTVVISGVEQTLDLRPEIQFRALCAAADRDYTRAERELLPDGTPTQPPCG
ncbi:nSTAND1 domain-containing NTPase [Micromonospora matsumotoense]|nr:trypsin-like peptidase domain-containing protein [Micromonospora matsumotoense]